MPLTEMFSSLDTKDWLIQCKKMKNYKIIKYLHWSEAFPFYLWNIWIAKNENLFNNKNNPIPINLARHQALESKFLAGKHIITKDDGDTERELDRLGSSECRPETKYRWGSFDYANNVGGAGGQSLLRELGNPLVRHEGRGLNKATDILAKAGWKKERSKSVF